MEKWILYRLIYATHPFKRVPIAIIFADANLDANLKEIEKEVFEGFGLKEWGVGCVHVLEKLSDYPDEIDLIKTPLPEYHLVETESKKLRFY